MTQIGIVTKLGRICDPESSEMCSVAILRDGSSPVLAALNGKALAVVMPDSMLDDSTMPREQLPRRIPAGLCTGSAKNPNVIQIGAGVNRSLFGPEMVAVSQSMGRFAQVRDAVPFPSATADVMPPVDDQWVCIEVNVRQLLELAHAITSSDNDAGADTVLLGVHHTESKVIVQGDQGAGVLLIKHYHPDDLGVYSTLRKVVRDALGGGKAARPSEAVSSVTISTKRPNGEVNAVTLTAKTFDRAAEIAERIKDGHSTTPTTYPASLSGMSEEQVFDLLLCDLPGMNDAAANRLSEAGIFTIREYAARAGKPGGIRTVKGIGEAKAERLEEVVNSVWARWKKDNTAPG